MQRGGPAHAVGRAFNQGVEGQRAVEAVFKRRAGGFFGNAQANRLWNVRAFEGCESWMRFYGGFARSKR
jgi:hypothetical protein